MANRRTAHELDASRIRARRRRRLLLGWPPDRLDEPPRVYGRPKLPPPEPIPDLDSHPIVSRALDALKPYERTEIGAGMDSIARDLVGAFCLAEIAGDDPHEAVRRERGRYAHDRRQLIHGLSTVTGLER